MTAHHRATALALLAAAGLALTACEPAAARSRGHTPPSAGASAWTRRLAPR
ncbi:hypothetical protein ABT095_30595 [Kitasatospora sp. NPDC002227]|uniref:hypothetical protein n=1 Tax=Kitasatospora sp. NPDC002227 TaxID=3154773 RepID=UPI0033259A42